MVAALGLDGCKAGWIGVLLAGDPPPAAVFGSTIDAVLRAAEAVAPIDVIAIDIPIGIPEAGRREADAQARSMLAGRASSVFSTPIRAALEAPTFAEANATSLELAGKGLSQQSYALRTKILEIDAYLSRATAVVIEVHPEVVFAQLNGGVAVPWSKKTWAGHERRRALLAAEGIVLSGELGAAGAQAASDDMLDAAAVDGHSMSMRRSRGHCSAQDRLLVTAGIRPIGGGARSIRRSCRGGRDGRGGSRAWSCPQR